MVSGGFRSFLVLVSMIKLIVDILAAQMLYIFLKVTSATKLFFVIK